MDKETLSNYGWITICVLVIAVMVALATPFGSYIKSAVENTTQGLYDTSAGAINSTDLMHIAGQSFASDEGGSGSAYNHDDPALHPTGTIPEGCSYYLGSSLEQCVWCGSYTNVVGLTCPSCGYQFTSAPAQITAGNPFPATVSQSDLFKTTDYTYSYKTPYGGWDVAVKDDSKSSYEPILESINGEPVTNMYGTFHECTSLTTAPTIPNSVTNMFCTFIGCTSLTTAPAIPASVTNMESTFVGCTSLTAAPEIPSSVTNMDQTFDGCTSLTTAPTIPSSVTSMNYAFKNCTSLTTAPTIPSSVTRMNSTFKGCTSLTTAPEIPSSVTRMDCAFQNCTSLTTAPTIPSSVTNIKQTFDGCTSLTGNIEINTTPTTISKYQYCLRNTQITSVTGTTTLTLSQLQ